MKRELKVKELSLYDSIITLKGEEATITSLSIYNYSDEDEDAIQVKHVDPITGRTTSVVWEANMKIELTL